MEKRLSVNLQGGRHSDVYFSSSFDDLLKKTEEWGDNVFWVFDENSAKLLFSLPEKRIVLESGEIHKNISSLEAIISSALESGAARDTRFIAFGGGVILDMCALASSLYMRGARLTLIPTTLLSMVDATLGGKSAIDYKGGKNLVGTFYPADEILIEVSTLSTLPDKEFRCGMGEVIKHAFLSSSTELFGFLEANKDAIEKRDRSTLETLVLMSLEVKKEFLEKDPLETKGIRSFLNLGHTFAHALESMEGYSVSHGEAVAWGLGRAIEASSGLGLVSQSFSTSSLNLLRSYGYDVDYRIGKDQWEPFLQAMRKDKKKSNGVVNFVLLKGFGEPLLMPLEDDFVSSLTVSP